MMHRQISSLLKALCLLPLIVKTAVTLALVVVPFEQVMYGRGESRMIEIP